MPRQFESQPIPELGNRTWDELEVVEGSDGYLLFPDEIRKRQADGKWKAEKVRVRVVKPWDILRAKNETYELFAEKFKKLDPVRDRSTFEEIEQYVLLSYAIREPKGEPSQFATVDELWTQYDEASLQDVQGRIHLYKSLVDPRESKLTEDELWQKVFAVRRARHTGPLADIVGPEQFSCIVFMASQAALSPKAQLWLRSQEISTPEPSPPTNSGD